MGPTRSRKTDHSFAIIPLVKGLTLARSRIVFLHPPVPSYLILLLLAGRIHLIHNGATYHLTYVPIPRSTTSHHITRAARIHGLY